MNVGLRNFRIRSMGSIWMTSTSSPNIDLCTVVDPAVLKGAATGGRDVTAVMHRGHFAAPIFRCPAKSNVAFLRSDKTSRTKPAVSIFFY